MSFVVYKDERDNYHYTDEGDYWKIQKYLEVRKLFTNYVEVETKSGNKYKGKLAEEYENDTVEVTGDDKVDHLIPIWSIKSITFFRKE